MSTIFFSYRREDTAGYSGRIYDDLVSEFGEDEVFRDVDTIGPGDDFVRAVVDAVSKAGVVLVVIGPRWLQATSGGTRRIDDPDDFVRLEVGTALATRRTVLPILVDGATVPSPDELPEPLKPMARHNAIELSDERWDYDVERLIQAIRRLVDLPATAASQVTPPPEAVPTPPARRLRPLLGLLGIVPLFAMIFGIGKILDSAGDGSYQAGTDDPPGAEVAKTAQVQIGKTAWYQGFEMAFTGADLRTTERGPQVDISLTLENESPEAVSLDEQVGFDRAFLSSRQHHYELTGGDLPRLPGKAKGKAVMSFSVDGEFSFDDAVLTLGQQKNNQTVVPLGKGAEAVVRTPRPLQIAGSVSVEYVALAVSVTELRWDAVFDGRGAPTPLPKGSAGLAVTFDATTKAQHGYNLNGDALALKLPDGRTLFSDYCCALVSATAPVSGLRANFVVNDPPTGAYTFTLLARDENNNKVSKDLAFKID